MTIKYIKNNPSDQKTWLPNMVDSGKVGNHLVNHVKNATPHDTSGVEGVSSKVEITPPYPISSAPETTIYHVSFNPYPLPKTLTFNEVNEQLKIDIGLLRSQGKTDKSILVSLKNKYTETYTRTQKHFEYKKKNVEADLKAKGDELDPSFRYLLPVLEAIGFKPDGVQHIDQIVPGAGYRIGNIRWLTPSENMANKCTAAHNAPLVQAGVAKPTPNLLDAERIFDCWYYQYSKNYPDALTPERTKDVLNKINNNIISKYKANCDKVLWVIPFLMERWDSASYTYYEAINEAHGSRLPSHPDLESVWRYITPVMLFVPPLLKAYEDKHGTFVPRWEKLEQEAELARMRRRHVETTIKHLEIVQAAFEKTEAYPYVLYLLLAFDPLVPGHRIGEPHAKMLSEVTAETGLTAEEYRAFRTAYLYDFTPEKRNKITKWFELWQSENQTQH
jgi:hypothetical protein